MNSPTLGNHLPDWHRTKTLLSLGVYFSPRTLGMKGLGFLREFYSVVDFAQ
jgi:hypothetical protein